MQETSLTYFLNEIIRIIDYSPKFLTLKNNQIITPIGDFYPIIIKRKSPLENEPANFDQLTNLVNSLRSNIVRLNHVGFGYQVASKIEEESRLIQLVKKTKLHLYEESSSDESIWLFLGNTKNWQQPMIEISPIDKITRWKRWQNYWLSVFHFDIDTRLTSKQILPLVNKIYGEGFEPHLIAVDGITYAVRHRLGIIDGVNIFFDIGTNSRNVEYFRKNILKQLI